MPKYIGCALVSVIPATWRLTASITRLLRRDCRDWNHRTGFVSDPSARFRALSAQTESRRRALHDDWFGVRPPDTLFAFSCHGGFCPWLQLFGGVRRSKLTLWLPLLLTLWLQLLVLSLVSFCKKRSIICSLFTPCESCWNIC